MPERVRAKSKKAAKGSISTAHETIITNGLFSGLHFYFFPNGRTNRARALRIDRAVQNGARFCAQWSENVTHVIFDDGMPFQEFTKFHRDVDLTSTTVVITNARYVVDCMAYNMLLTPTQKVYRVPGHGEPDPHLKRTRSEPVLAMESPRPILQKAATDLNISHTTASNHHTESMEHNSLVGVIGSGTTFTKKNVTVNADHGSSQEAIAAGPRADSMESKSAVAPADSSSTKDVTHTATTKRQAVEDELAEIIREARAMEDMSAKRLHERHSRPISVQAIGEDSASRKPLENDTPGGNRIPSVVMPPAARPPSPLNALRTSSPVDEDPMIMRRPSDGHWVKLRCRECGEAAFQDVREFLKHCAFIHRIRFKSKNEAIESWGCPLKSYVPKLTPPPKSPAQVVTDAAQVLDSQVSGHAEDDSSDRPPSSRHSAEPEGSPRDEDDMGGPPSKRRRKSWEDNFICMTSNNGKSSQSGPNADIIEKLQEMAEFYDRTGDQWRMLSFRRGISSLKKQTVRITTKEDARKLPFVGDSLAEAIEKIVQTGTLRRLEATKADPTNQSLELFMGIYGVGLAQASKWVSAGYKTLDDILEKAELTPNQRFGISHYHDLQQRIPRAEVEAHAAIVKTALEETDPAFQMTIGGSYRRGKASSGDIDLIITKPGAQLHEIRILITEFVVPSLFKSSFLKTALATSSSDNGSKWHGCSALPPEDGKERPWRRIDLLLVPWEEMGAALLYFTGNDIFNRSMRLLASKKGMRLNQRGLYKDVMRGKGRERMTDGELLESKDERQIFEILGVPWREPGERNA